MTERDFYLSSHLNSFAIFVFVPTVQNLERQGVKKKRQQLNISCRICCIFLSFNVQCQVICRK